MNLHYRKEIDGLRALAVVSIIFFHAGYKAFNGGYVGVDIFFVISGFLITSIILKDIQQGKFHLVEFYERRARRLLPALFCVILVSMIFAWVWMLPNEITEFSQSVLSVLFFVSNFFFWNDSGYFSTSAEFRPLLHTWSLAVEEQFYLLFPAILIFSLLLKRLYTTSILVLIGVLSFVFSIWASTYKPTLAFFLIPSRIWEFVLGSLAATLVLRPSFDTWLLKRVYRELVCVVGLVLILYSVFFFKKDMVYPGYLAVVPTLGTVLLLVFTTHETVVGKLLGLKPIVVVGVISYSAYLWHQPLFAFMRLRELDPLSLEISALLIFLSFALGYLTWRFIEPIWRIKKGTIRAKSFWVFIAISASTFILFFLVIKYTGGYLLRLNHLPRDYFQTSWINYKFQDINGERCYTDVMKPCPLTAFPDAKRKMLLVGDSHAGDMGTVFTQYLNKYKLNGSMFSVIGCGYVSVLKDTVSNKSCSNSRSLLLDLVSKNSFDTYLVVSAGGVQSAQEAEEFQALMERLLASGAEVILFEPRMRLKYDPKKAGALNLNEKNMVVTYAPELSKDWNAVLTRLSQYKNFKIFDQYEVLLDLGCGEITCFNGHSKDGHLIFRDPTHLTDLGTQTVMNSFDDWYKNQSLHSLN
jgi:peptidoglycan/LPS O-acetylase OafA/YrhL